MKRSFDIYYTSDVHGKIFPVDYVSGKPVSCGILNYAKDIKRNGNTLVLDGGDNLQGTPMMSYYLEHAGEFDFHPLAEAFSEAGLDCFTLGNHDFNFGYEVLSSYLSAMSGLGADCVCVNVRDKAGELPIKPYIIRVLDNGLRIGITGAVTEYVNIWEKPEHLSRLSVTDPVEELRKIYEPLRALCDLTICIYHGGYEEELDSGKKISTSKENRACEISRELGFDILLTAHQHILTEGRWIGNSFTVQPAPNLDSYIHIEGSPDENDNEGRPVFSARAEAVGDSHDEPGCRGLYELEKRSKNWLDLEIGVLKGGIRAEEKLDIALNGSRIAALINHIQLKEGCADFSCTSLGNTPIGIPESISIRSIYSLYPFANNIIVKEVDIKTLKAALERCAEYLELDSEGRPYISDAFLKPKQEHYNYDIYAGLDYAFDLRRPVGQRVVRLCRIDGEELSENKSYRLAMSNYRATGTGGYPMLAKAAELYSGADNVQELLISYIRKNGCIAPIQNSKFKVIY